MAMIWTLGAMLRRQRLAVVLFATMLAIYLPMVSFAVAQEGAEFYAFEFNEAHFDRRAVHVEYRDQDSAVIANDGSLRLGGTVAASAAVDSDDTGAVADMATAIDALLGVRL